MAILKKTAPAKRQSNATIAVKSQKKVGSGFAPGSRPGVITRSGQNVFKDGKLIGRYNDEAKAKAAVSEFTSRGQNGRITNIEGDTGGETFRQLNRVNKGQQTGRANTAGIRDAVQSRGFVAEVGTDAQGRERVVGAQTPQGVQNVQASQAREQARQEQKLRDSQTAYVAGQPFSRQAPVAQDKTRENEARARIAQERGIDLNTASAGQRMLLNEAVNTDVYGTARPRFASGADVLTAEQKTQEQIIAGKRQPKAVFSIPENLQTGIDQTVVTTKGAQEFTDAQLAEFETYNQDNSDTVTSALDGLLESDPDILSAQQSGEDMQSLLDERRAFYEEQYNSLKEQIASIYDAKESDYREQAAQAMGAATVAMASIGAFGTSTQSMRYIDDVSRQNEAAIMALATEESTALTQAYSAFMEADFGLAEEMITNAKNTRQEIRQIKADQLTRQKTLMELKQMERETSAQTISALVTSGMSEADVPSGYFDYLDTKSGYVPGTSRGLLRVAEQEKQMAAIASAQESQAAAIKQATDLVDLLGKIPPGEKITIGGVEYSSFNTGEVVTGTEVGSDGKTYLWSYNKTTGQYETRNLGIPGSQKYTDITSNEGAIVRVYEDGTQRIMFDPTKPNGGYASGGLISAFPEGSISPFTRSNERGGKQMATECGAWVNDVTGLGVGNTFDSKMAVTDSSITADTAQIGDVFVQPYGTTGHIGIINGKSIVNGEVVFTVSESNWSKNAEGYGLITHTRQMKASEISGYARPGFNNPVYNFGSDSTEGLTFGEEPTAEEATQEVEAQAQQTSDILSLIENLRSNQDVLANAVGPVSSRLPTLRGDTADFETRFNNLVALLTVDNLALLKGPMSDKDIEFIKQASSGLSTSMSEKGFNERLLEIYSRIALPSLQSEFPNIEKSQIESALNNGFSVEEIRNYLSNL